MRLLVVSHTGHHRARDTVVGWGPTVREIDQLASLFDEVVHVAPLHPGPPPAAALPYESPRVRLVPVRPAGGDRWLEKLGLLRVAPEYFATLRRELARCDVVHVRCPAAISLAAVVLLCLGAGPDRRWIKYAGNWGGGAREPFGYALQRRILAGTSHRATVTVNGAWPGQPAHVLSFRNPCLTEKELREGERAAAHKRISEPVRLLFVGRLDAAKGAGRVLEVVALLARHGMASHATIVGEGPERQELERRAAGLPAPGTARLAGSLPRSELGALYADAHFLLLPSRSSEGWPKVLSEGMAYGVVPLAGDVGAVGPLLRQLGIGRAAPPEDCGAFADAVADYVRRPDVWRGESKRAVSLAPDFGYSRYLEAVADLLGLPTAKTQHA